MMFRTDLQGLRALAIVLVILAHARFDVFRGGFIGVDVFFVLSGYLITGLLIRELHQTGCIRFIDFYSRRLKRLLPALAAMLVFVTGTAVWLLSDLEARTQLASAPYAATWTSNLYLVLVEIDYFNEMAARDLFLHTWSLGVEEQFYLIWPAFLLVLFLARRRFSGISGAPSRLEWLGLGLLGAVSLVFAWTLSNPTAAYYLMPTRIWQFALGALVFLAVTDRATPAAHAKIALPSPIAEILNRLGFWIGILLIVASAMFLDPSLAYPHPWSLVPSLGTALVIATGDRLSMAHRNPLSHIALVWLGDRSYSWYLWHWPILTLGFALGFAEHLSVVWGLILLSLLMATLSYRLIEYPFWKGRFSHAKPLRILLISLLAMAVCVGILFQVLRALERNETNAASDTAGLVVQADIPLIYQMHCDAWYAHANVEPCVFGKPDAQRTVVLLGDSIGAQWFSMVPALFPEPVWRTVVLTKSSCPWVDEDFFYERIGQVYRVCTEWRNAVLDELARNPPDVLIVGSAATYPFTETQWIEGSARVLERLSQAADAVILIPGTPSLGFDGPGCVARNLSSQGSIRLDACQASNRLTLVEPVRHYLEQSAGRFANVHLLDLNDLVCPEGLCNAVSQDGLLVFRDSQHLTDRFVRAQLPAIQARLKILIPEP